MPLTLKIVSEHAELVGEDFERVFYEDGATIGRSLQNDWILPDPDRFISGRHATLDFRGGIYYLADTSSNGVYINDEYEPIGRGNVRRLFNGDRLRMGDFQFEVNIDAGESLVVPLDEVDGDAVDPDIEQKVDEISLRTGVQLLDEDEIRGDDVFESALFGKDDESVDIDPETEPPPPGLDVSDVFEEAIADEKEPKSADVKVTAEDLFDMFLDGLGLSRLDFHPSISRPEMMQTAGQILREMVKGTADLLSSRANLKNAFRLDQTTLLPRYNNPMKFSRNTNDLLKQLLTGGEGDYLGARDSIREVNRDLLNHQNAFLDAMSSAFEEFAERFEPAELQEGFDSALGSGLLSFMNKSKYWDLYADIYPILTERGGNRFPQMFAEEFISAYERRIAEYRRRDREGLSGPADAEDDPGLLETQRLDVPMPAQASNEPAFHEGVDQDFIDELDNSMAEEIDRDQLKA